MGISEERTSETGCMVLIGTQRKEPEAKLDFVQSLFRGRTPAFSVAFELRGFSNVACLPLTLI